MANEQLKNALDRAGLAPEEFAEVIQVDPKSVGRWLAGTSVPYPKRRKAISQALNLPEHELWPEHATEPAANETNSAGADVEPETRSTAAKDGSGAGRCGDVSGAWASADDATAPDLATLITAATGPVEILDSCCGIQITAAVTDALARHATAGHSVRILTDARQSNWEPLLGQAGIELYLCEIPGEYWLIKTRERMLVTINLESDPGSSPPPMLELTASHRGGLFERFDSKFKDLWNRVSGTAPSGAHTQPARSQTQSAAEPHDASSAATGRLWPRQPNA